MKFYVLSNSTIVNTGIPIDVDQSPINSCSRSQSLCSSAKRSTSTHRCNTEYMKRIKRQYSGKRTQSITSMGYCECPDDYDLDNVSIRLLLFILQS